MLVLKYILTLHCYQCKMNIYTEMLRPIKRPYIGYQTPSSSVGTRFMKLNTHLLLVLRM